MTNGGRSTRFLVEGVVIVVSILLAFGIDAAWDEREERRSERRAIASLHTEAEANRGLIEISISQVRSDLDRVDDFFRMPDQALDAIPADFETSELIQSLWRPNTYRLNDGAMEGLARSGRLELIQDPVLRQRLIDWQGEAADLEERHAALSTLELQIMSAIGRHPEVRRWLATDGRPNNPGEAAPGGGGGQFLTTLRPIREDPAVMSGVAAMQFQRRVYLMALDRLGESLDDLIDELSRRR